MPCSFRMLAGVMLILVAATALPGRRLAIGQELTSKNNPQLQRALERFPAADANRDGVLTISEAQAYRDRVSPQRSAARGESAPSPTHADVRYGPHERNVLDLWLAPSNKPTPVAVFIHGGGFVGGDKRQISASVIEAARKAGISVASINYRFVTTAPFPAPQHDGARAIQFLRAKAKDYNLDEERVAAFGGSAGAGISLWLAFHDDMADPSSDDPISRQSTRLTCVGSLGGQTTYDPRVIREWVGGRAHEHPSIYLCYGIKNLDEIDDASRVPLYDEVSAIKHLTADDPPVIMFYNEPNGPLPADAKPGQGIHHPVFGLKLKEAMDRLGIEAVYHHQDEFKGNPQSELLDFFRRHFDKAS